MIPSIGSHLKCMLKNNIVMEGILQNWATDGVELKSLDDNRLIIIMDPTDIMMITVSLVEEKTEEILALPLPMSELEEKFQEVYEQPSGDSNRHKSLAQLKIMMAEQERKIVANKIKSHHIGETRKVKYGYPGLFEKPGTK